MTTASKKREARLKQIFDWFQFIGHRQMTMHGFTEYWDCGESEARSYLKELTARKLITYSKSAECIKVGKRSRFTQVTYSIEVLRSDFPVAPELLPLPEPKPLVRVEKPHYGAAAIYFAQQKIILDRVYGGFPTPPPREVQRVEVSETPYKPRAFKKTPAPKTTKEKLLVCLKESPKGLESNRRLAQLIGRSVSRTKAIMGEFRRSGKIDSVVQKHFMPNYQAWSNQRVFWMK